MLPIKSNLESSNIIERSSTIIANQTGQKIIVTGKNEQQTAGVAKSLSVAAPIASEIRLLGPVKAPIYMLRGNYRYRILIKTSRTINIQKWLKSLISSVKVPSSVVVKIDIDPYSFM